MADKSPGSSLKPLPPIRSSSKKPASPGSGVKNVQTIQKIYEEASNEEEADAEEVAIRKPSRIGPIISKSQYFNLQRHSSAPGDRIDKLKESFQKKRPKSEGNLNIAREVSIDAAIKEAAVEIAASKTKSSAALESPKTEKKVSFTDVLVNPKEPVPSQRKSLENKIEEKYERDNPFISATNESPKNRSKAPLRNRAKAKEVRVVKVKFDTIQYAEPESRHIIVRQDSVDSINLIQEGLDFFEMDEKKLGRRRSFKGIRNLFTSKSKKKEDDVKDKKNQNAIVGENYENENFNRASPMRHTAESSYYKNFQSSQSPGAYQQNGPKEVNATQTEIENNFAQMHLHKYAEVKKRFINGGPITKSPEEYVCMDSPPSMHLDREASHNGSYISDITKNHDTCSSNTDSETTSGTYENALIAQAEMLQRQQVHQQKPMPPPRDYSNRNKYLPGNQLDQFSDRRTDTPPRAQETYQNLELIKPKASIPINSERPLPNPYTNTSEKNSPFNKTIERNLNNDQFSPKIAASNAKEVLVNDIYGTVYDAKLPLSRQSSISGAVSPTNFARKSPTKLKLPANREKVELVPRMKSPIPQSVVSTDKIIATELLKNKKGKEDKANVSTHQNLSIEIDYPLENMYYNSTSPRQDRSLERNSSNQKQISTLAPPQKIPNNITGRTEMIPTENTPTSQGNSIANVMADVHSNANHSWSSQHMQQQQQQQQLSPYYSPIPPQDRRSSLSLSPSKRFSPSPLTRSPSKQEIRQSVEAFCWKEIKKLKDKQEEHLFGSVQVPDRNSRSMNINTERGRRSLSLPREMPKARRNLDMYYQHQVSLQMPVQQEVIYEVTPSGQYFVRNSPQRRTIESMHKSSSHLPNVSTTTKPIFNRGSLQQHTQLPYGNSNNADYNKKVSFINSQTIQQSWPTKNGYVQSPPQRRLDAIQRMESMEDDVFLPGQHNNMRSNTRPPSASNPHHQQQQIEHQRRMYEQHLQQQQQLQQESMYGQVGTAAQQQPVRRLTLEEMHYLKQQQINQEPIYGRRQVAENLYGRTVAPVVFDPQYGSMQRRKVLEPQEPIYGARYGTPVHRTVTDGPSRMARPVLPPPITPDQGGGCYVRQVRVNNKECDIYGQIHEKNKQMLRNAQVQQSGVMYGQLQRNANAGPIQHNSYNQLIGNGQQQQQGFVRNSRLTASANDMHRNVGPQYQRPRNNETKHPEDPIYGQQATVYYDHQSTRGPIRPLPSVPNNRGPEAAKVPMRMMPNECNNQQKHQQQQQQEQQQQQQVPKKGSIKKSKVKSGK